MDKQKTMGNKDNPFIKQLAEDYNFMSYAYRLYISEQASDEREQKISRLRQLLCRIKKKALELLKITETMPEPVVKPEPPKYLWDTPLKARHSVRVICDEEGLSWNAKNLISQVINCESGYKINATHKNVDGTIDYGICMYNSYWYINKMKLITKDQALNDPEFCVRLMIKRYKQGLLRNWVCYSKKLYENFSS